MNTHKHQRHCRADKGYTCTCFPDTDELFNNLFTDEKHDEHEGHQTIDVGDSEHVDTVCVECSENAEIGGVIV